jgi:hypothetical protein
MMKTKAFDCVEMKRLGQQRLRERLSGMNTQQRNEWWKQRSQEFLRKQQRIAAEQGSHVKGGAAPA